MPRHHLAILQQPFLGQILQGYKTVESRFTSVRCAPYGQITKGDVLWLKESGGPIRGQCTVKWAESCELTPAVFQRIRQQHGSAICPTPSEAFWQERQHKRYATLIGLAAPEAFLTPFPYPRKGQSGWVVLSAPPTLITAPLPTP